MNPATENLENDHVHILRLTEVITGMVEKRSKEIVHFELVVELIRKYADGLHHVKEENLLFPLLGEKGFSPEMGPVAVMLNEHEQGRNFVRATLEGIEEFKNGNYAELQTIYENLGNYSTLLQNHISKENNILFRMADEVLSDREQQNLLVKFVELESSAGLEFNTSDSVQKIDYLASIYL